ncbi:hypothetical protein Nepgr_012038 [Nepenthes gracilis]|uniref:Uncharacterized protein n=1 Tax=Nepenthes gracilis TaxID=150966 RepID=A0AAD3XMH9_NEPGR|nr:hypothetical protein Nepgr_012038 [Nepenthes gracilis]
MMAEDLDDGEFWLPSQFLTDDDILVDFAGNATSMEKCSFNGYDGFGSNVSGFGSFDPNSNNNPSMDSVTDATEAESDEEEYIAWLTRQMARSTLEDCVTNTKGWVLSGSPQSTLCAVGGGRGCDCNHCSSHGSPNGLVSPPPTNCENSDAALDLLCAAAGEVARLGVRIGHEKGTGFFDSNRAFAYTPRKSVQVPSPLPKINSTAPNGCDLYTRHPISHPKLQQLGQQEVMEQLNQGIWGGPVKSSGQQNRAMRNNSTNDSVLNEVGRKSNNNRPQSLSSTAWPPLQRNQQQQPPLPGTGMRAVFLGTPASKRESAGTGVFLPRPTDSRKKPACSTVLLPAKVVLALNNINALSRHRNPSRAPDGAVRIRANSGNGLESQRRNLRPQSASSNGTLLPQEWAY